VVNDSCCWRGAVLVKRQNWASKVNYAGRAWILDCG
jgi:hypothetical protein